MEKEQEPLTITLDGKSTTTLAHSQQRLSMILWGQSGCGKTSLAATAPGKILWLNFDNEGLTSVKHYGDKIIPFDFSIESASIVERFKDEDTLLMKQLDKVLRDNPDIQTIVFDSVTAFGEMALQFGVKDARKTKKGKNSTLEDPGFAGFGRKSTWSLAAMSSLIRVTGKYNKNFIAICHEDAPTRDDKGTILFISILVGSALQQKIPIQLSEVWYMEDLGKEGRRIAIRPCRMRKPMKTRMFHTTGPIEFKWNFNAETMEGEGIEDWFNAWKDNNFEKIDLPK